MNVRSIRPEDLNSILDIERVSFPNPWTKKTFCSSLGNKENVGLLIEDKSKILGYVIYRVSSTQLFIINIAVSPLERRKKIGTNLVNRVISNLDNRKKIFITVSDQSLDAHLFLKSLEFKAIKILKDFFDKGHDGYNFIYKKQVVRKTKSLDRTGAKK
jgi:ribosomal-protein-alanine N-acetyltransferase